jgi:23S rRNA pseudouridine2605 synthase
MAPMTEDQKKTPAGEKGERIAKRMARAGLCSRRDAERWIAAGRVALNGAVLDSPAVTVTDADTIVVDGKAIAQKEPTRLWRYHKPDGLVTSHRDERGRETIFDHMPENMPRVISVGRLDLTSEGLLLLTNDGGLARHLELPSTGWTRKYRVRAFGDVTQAQLDALKSGVKVEGVFYSGIEAHIDRHTGSNIWLHMSLREGKNREIRRVLAYLGLEVNRLLRLSYGPFQLGHLPEGAVEEIPLSVLRESLGDKFKV